MTGLRTQRASLARPGGPYAATHPSPLEDGFVRKSPRAWLALLGAAAVHGLLGLGANALVHLPHRVERPVRVASTQWFDLELQPEPASPLPTREPDAEPERAVARVRTVRPEPARSAPAPAAAQAAQVLVNAPESEVVDFGETFVQGHASSHAGGTTEAHGTASHAVHDGAARGAGSDGGQGKDPSGADRSRAAALASGASWDDCPFPEEADRLGVDEAHVTLRVRVSASGAVERVDVVDDPGDGFGREARRCALHRRWQPGLDRSGNALASSALIKVRFTR